MPSRFPTSFHLWVFLTCRWKGIWVGLCCYDGVTLSTALSQLVIVIIIKLLILRGNYWLAFTGVSHVDDLFYLFPMTKGFAPQSVPTTTDTYIQLVLTEMWVNFATNGWVSLYIQRSGVLAKLICRDWLMELGHGFALHYFLSPLAGSRLVVPWIMWPGKLRGAIPWISFASVIMVSRRKVW